MNSRVQHGTDQREANQQRSRTSAGQRLSGTDEKTGSDGTTDSNHLKMTILEFSGERGLGDSLCGQFEINMSGSGCGLSFSVRGNLDWVLSERIDEAAKPSSL
jgi:hypothetical protein